MSERTSIALNISDYEKLKKAKEAFEKFEGKKLSWGKFLFSLSTATLIGLGLINEVDR